MTFPDLLVQLSAFEWRLKLTQKNNGGGHHSLESNVCHKNTLSWTLFETRLDKDTQRSAHLQTNTVSKCQESIWKAVVIAVKAGQQRDARLTLLPFFYQHKAPHWQDNFSLTALVKTKHAVHTLRSGQKASQCRFVVPTQSAETTCRSHEIKRAPQSRWKTPFPIAFTC